MATDLDGLFYLHREDLGLCTLVCCYTLGQKSCDIATCPTLCMCMEHCMTLSANLITISLPIKFFYGRDGVALNHTLNLVL